MRQDAVILFFLLYSKHIKHKNNNYMNFCIIDKEFLNKKIPEAVIGFSPNLPDDSTVNTHFSPNLFSLESLHTIIE